MTRDDGPRPTPTESLAFDFDLPHPPEKVWRALTDPEQLGEWLLPVAGLDLRPGSEFTFRAPAQPGWDGVVSCRLVEAEAPRVIRYTWVVGDMDTLVTFTLTPTAAGTRVSLLHEGFRPDQKQNLGGARYGWKLMGGRLAELLARTA